MNRPAHPCPVEREHLRDIQQRLMRGSEIELKHWMTLSRVERAKESVAFLGLYLVGCLISVYSGGMDGVWAVLLSCFGILAMGFACNSLGLFLHEGLHGALSNNKSANKMWSFLVGVPLLISATSYRVTHTYHHIELGQARDYGTYKQHTQKPAIVWLCYYLQLLLGSLIYITCIPFLGYRQANRLVKRRIFVEYLIIVSVLLLAITYVPLAVLTQYWLLPMLVMNVLTNIRGLASHALGDTGDPLLASRTINASPLVSWLMLYENYHLAHHLFPKIPSYHLKEVHEHIWHRLPHACWNASYVQFLSEFTRASVGGSLEPLGLVQPNRVVMSKNV